MNLNKTVYLKPLAKQWHVIDAQWQTLGRLATRVSEYLMGKNKPHQCDFWDNGDHVVIVNTDKVAVTGSKPLQKLYHTYSGRKWNVKTKTYRDVLAATPSKILELAVRWMLPKNKLRDKRMKRLHLFAQPNHTFTTIK